MSNTSNAPVSHPPVSQISGHSKPLSSLVSPYVSEFELEYPDPAKRYRAPLYELHNYGVALRGNSVLASQIYKSIKDGTADRDVIAKWIDPSVATEKVSQAYSFPTEGGIVSHTGDMKDGSTIKKLNRQRE